MKERIIVRRGTYHDSVFLMRLARQLGASDRVDEAVVLMGTDMNLKLLQDAGFASQELETAGPMDMVAAFRAEADTGLDLAEKELDRLLEGVETAVQVATGEVRFGSLEEAAAALPGASLVSVAVPGAYAGYVARQALEAGKHVFLFSDNVDLDEEVALKKRALELGLLMMGPDCGTAVIAGVGLGFANRVQKGKVGIVGASGTGIQEICSLLDGAGLGISHAVGTGSRDLSAEVGGAMTGFGLNLLAADDETEVLVLVAKHPEEGVAERMHCVLMQLGKPVVVRYVGTDPRTSEGQVQYAGTLDEAAAAAALLAGGDTAQKPDPAAAAAGEARKLFGGDIEVEGRLVGLFGGGSLASEAAMILERAGRPLVIPERPLQAGGSLDQFGSAHLIVDVGEDFYTVGRPHPMVDQTVRCELIRRLGADPSVGLVLFDLVLGDGAHPDPAPELVAAVGEARKARAPDRLEVIGSVSGTASDPQGIARQRKALTDGGIRVADTATAAAFLAASVIGSGEGRAS